MEIVVGVPNLTTYPCTMAVKATVSAQMSDRVKASGERVNSWMTVRWQAYPLECGSSPIR